MIKIAICDDEKIICCQLHRMLEQHRRAQELMITEYYTGESLCNSLKSGMYFDLIILDIVFPGISGVDVGIFLRDTLKDTLTQILYISGKEGYERALFDVRPLNFLPKPVQTDKLFACVDTAIQLMNKELPCFLFTTNRIIYRVPFRDILYFESEDKRVNIYAVNGCYSTIQKLADIKSPDNFVRIHKSYLVNYTYIKSVQYEWVVICDNQRLPISRKYRNSVQQFLFSHNT